MRAILRGGFFICIFTKTLKMEGIVNDTLRAKFLRKVNKGYSYCGGCGLPWNHCKSKAVYTSPVLGTFATCQDCWDTLSLEELKYCYTATYLDQANGLKMFRDEDGKQYEMEHTLEHLLECVEEEFKNTRE